MEEIINRNEFLKQYKSLKSRIYAIPNEDARDEMFIFLKDTRKLYLESRVRMSVYLDNVDQKVKKCFKDIDYLIDSYPK